MVGHLLDMELAVIVGLDHEDAIDLEQARDLGVDEVVVRRHRQRRVREAGDDEGVGALGCNRALCQHPLVVCDLRGDDRCVVRTASGGRLVLVIVDTPAP